jgi:hypothetical protein
MAARSSFSNRLVVVGMIICLTLLTIGCKSLFKKKGKDAGAGGGTVALTGSDLADDQLLEKLDEYISCLNTLSSPIHQGHHHYLNTVPKTGPRGTESNPDVTRLPPGAAAACSAGISRSKVMPPPEPKLESVGTEYSLAASEIDRLITEIDAYFELKMFRDDKWARGKLMHPRLMAAWDRFGKADRALHDTLTGITKPLSQRTLARIDRDDGKKYRYNRKKTLMSARELIDARNPVGDDDDIDFALYTATYTDFEKSLDELIAYGNTHRSDLSNSQLAPSWPMADTNYDEFIRTAGDFKKAAKEFWRCLGAAPASAKTPSGKIDMDKLNRCNGEFAFVSSNEVLKKYNEFIKTSNSRPFP